MKVDWRQRWLAIPYNGATVWIQGISPTGADSAEELLVQLFHLSDLSSQPEPQLPPAISQLLTEFPYVVNPPGVASKTRL